MPKHITRLIEKIFGKDGNNNDSNENQNDSDEHSLDITDGDDGLCSTPTDLATLRQKALDSKTEREKKRELNKRVKIERELKQKKEIEEKSRIERERIKKQKEDVEQAYRAAIQPYILKCIVWGNRHRGKRIHINWLKFKKFGYSPITYDTTTGHLPVPKEWYKIYEDVVDDICHGLRDDGIIDKHNYIGGAIGSIDIKSTVVILCL